MGLIGKIELTSEMDEDCIMAEIRSVFSQAMNHDPSFPFKILQSTGGGCKCLSVPATSTHYHWSASQVVSACGQGPIYILAGDVLQVPVSDFSNYLL